jgi:zinc protease
MQALHELLVRMATLPALHTNNGSSMIMQGYNAKFKRANKGIKISYVTLYASTTKPEETVKAMRIILSYMKNNKYTEKVLENVRKSHLHSYAKRQEIMSEIADQLGKAEIMGDWKLAENLASRMSAVNAEEMKNVINMYAKNLNWAYIGAPELGNASFNK